MRSPVKFCIAAGAILGCLWANPVRAQSQDGKGRSEIKQDAYKSGRDKFETKDFDRGEADLLAGNKSQAGTPQWSFESAVSLARVAFDLQGKGNGAAALVAAQKAVPHLDEAKRKFGARGNPAEVANVHELAGMICEQFLGDLTAAESNYAAAVGLAPQSGQAATLLARLRARQTEEQRKNRK